MRSNLLLPVLMMLFWMRTGLAGTERFKLPLTKLNLESCKNSAQRLHPGTIKDERNFSRDGGFVVRYLIQTSDESEWLVICDGGTGKITGEQKFIGQGF